jgi:phosphohistidine phosphatase SixA
VKNSSQSGRGLAVWLCSLWARLRGGEPAKVTARSRPGGGPSRILLMRHAEKTGDPEDIYLSAEGAKRAERLVTYIPETFGRPDFIFAASRSKRSVRSIETVKPLAAAFGLTVQHHFEDDDFEDLVSEIFSNPDYRGTTIVICWHHQKLPEIASFLGAEPGTSPDPWPQDVFNLILNFGYDPNSNALPSVTRVVEAF